MKYRYAALAEEIRGRIQAGVYQRGDRIPGEKVLAAEFGVSRSTVKSAVRLLESEDVLECRPAGGSFVLRRPASGLSIAYIHPNLSDPFNGRMVQAFNAAIETEKGQLTLVEAGTEPFDSRLVDQLRRLKAQGVQAAAVTTQSEQSWQEIRAVGLPVVWLFTETLPEGMDWDSVDVDHEHGIFQLLTHLEARGVKTVGYVSGRTGGRQDDARYRAFEKYLVNSRMRSESHWLQMVEVEGEKGGQAAMERLLSSGRPLPEAVVCYDDWNAIGLISTALEQGVQVPEQLKVTGFDDLLLARYVQVPITPVHSPREAVVEEALKIIRTRLATPSGPAVKSVFQCELKVRASA